MKLLKVLNVNIFILSLWLTPVLESYAADDEGGNLTIINNNSNDTIGEGRLQHQNEQLEKNQNYQKQDNSEDAYMKNSSCNQDSAGSVSDEFLPNALANQRLQRENDLLNKFSECLFNDMTEANVLAQRNQELNATLGDIGSFSGFGDVNGGGFDPAAYDNLRREKDRLGEELNRLRAQAAACFPTQSTQPDYCNGQTSSTLPNGCTDSSAYEQIKSKQRRLMMIEGDLLALEEKKNASETLATGDDNISSENRENLNNGSDHLDIMENWEKAKERYRQALIDEPIKENAYRSAYNACWQDEQGRFRNSTCEDEVNEKYGQWQLAINEITLADQEVKMYFGQMSSRNTAAQAGQSEASSRDGGAKAGVTLDSINSSAGAYGPFLDRISNVVAKSENLYNDAMANLTSAQNNLKARAQYTDEFGTYNLMRADFGDDTVQSTRDVQLLISDLGLMATASAGAQTMRCREIGYNKDTRQIDFRPNCPTSGANAALPKDLSGRMANPNATFKQCYVRSYDLFRAASAMYLAAEINAKENMNKVANECLMQCVALTDTTTLARYNIDPSKREANCMVRTDKNDPTSEVAGIFVNDGNAQDDKNEQMAALERAANLYGNMVTMAELKSSSKQQALDMYNVAYQAAMEEMTAKVQRVSTAQANLDAARAALRATNTALNLIIAAIAGYTAYKIAMSAMCGPYNPGACAEAARMVGVIAAAVAFMMLMKSQKGTAQQEVAYWMEELKDAQLHGHMACNYPGLNKNYQVLAVPSLTNEPTRAAIGLARTGTALTGVTLGDAELGATPTPIFDAAGRCIRYCDQGEIYIPPENDLYNAIEGNPDLEWAVQREGQLQNDVAQFDIFGNCIRYCSNLDLTPEDIEDTTSYSPPTAPQFPSLDTQFMLEHMQKYGVTKFLEFVLPTDAHASNVTIIDNDSTDLSSRAHTSQTDTDLGLSLGMPGLNETTDFSYFLAMKIEALKMQTLDNTTTVDLQANPVTVDHLVEWNGSNCDSDVYNTNIPGPEEEGSSAPNADDVNNRNSTIGCGVEMHLEDFADFEERNTSTFSSVPYKEELPEKTGFPLPETRHVYVMSVIRQLQKNMMLHNYRLGDCFSSSSNQDGTTLASAGSGVNEAPTTICGQANRYAQLVRYARRQMGLGDSGLDEVAIDNDYRANGICLKFSNLGNPVPDKECECRLNGSCVSYQNPVFGNFSGTMGRAGSLAIRAANDTLSGDLEGAGVAAGELSSISKAVRRSLRDSKQNIKEAAFGKNKVAANSFFKKNPSLDPGAGSQGTTGKNSFKDGDVGSSTGRSRYGSNRNVTAPNDPSKNGKKEGNASIATGTGSSNGKNKNSAEATSTGANSGLLVNGKPSFYAGSNLDLDIDGINLDDDINVKGGSIDFGALNALQKKEAADRERIARSFASESGKNGGLNGKDKKPSWGDAVHQDPNSSLFKIISRRYRKTAYPLFMPKK